MKKNRLLIALFTLTFILSACSNNEQTSVSVSVSSESNEEQTEVKEETALVSEKFKSSLTNTENDKDISKVRPLAIMFENTSDALPHYGLAHAGVVYEAVVEGAITRYMGVFDDYEDIERLGNVRSARPYFIYLAKEYDAVFISHGHSEDALSLLNSKIVDSYNGMFEITGFFRSTDKKAPHNSYLETNSLKEGLVKKNIDITFDKPKEYFNFSEGLNELSQGETAKYIKLYYVTNHPSFVYDENSATYKRYAFGDLEKDALSLEGISFTNLIFQDVNSRVLDSEGHMGIDLVGKGTGKFFTNGKVVDITWEKSSNTAKTKYYMQDGSEIALNAGKTYIALIENSGKDNNEILEKYEQ